MDRRNPFREYRREQRDRKDRIRHEVRTEIEPVPEVICTQCTTEEPMDYRRELSTVNVEQPLIEATWECPNCNGMAYGYVTRDGGLPVLDNARRADHE